MNRITGSEIVRLRNDLGSAYPEMVAVLRPTRTADGKGGWTNTYTVATQVNGRLSSLRGGDSQSYEGELGNSQGYVLTLPRGFTLRGTDRIRVRGITCEPIIDENDSPLRVAGRWICRKVDA